MTPTMPRWLHSHLEKGSLGKAGKAVAWAALMLGFFFVLRASEYLVQPDKAWSWDRVVHGDDVAPKEDGVEKATFVGADEIVVHLKGSKTDQYNVGCTRNHYRTHALLDPVGALEDLEKHFPQRLRGSESRSPLLRWQDSSVVKRSQVHDLLVLAAVAAGMEASEVGSHSLRIGGATAMYHVVGDLQQVRRFGRWASDAFHVYLWESHEPMKPIAAKMARDNTELVKTKEASKRARTELTRREANAQSFGGKRGAPSGGR